MFLNLHLAVLISSLIAVSHADSECVFLDPADDPNNYIRPCPDFNIDCIRQYFSKNSDCKVVDGPVPDPLSFNHYTLRVPHANLTAELYDVNVGGLSCHTIDEFYFNPVTNALVLAITVTSLNFNSPYTKFVLNRKFKEPIMRGDYVDCLYGPVTFTAVFQSITDLDLNAADVSSYVEDSRPKYTLGPGITENLDRQAQASLEKFLSSMTDSIQEKFVTQGRIFMNNIIEYNICNFESESK